MFPKINAEIETKFLYFRQFRWEMSSIKVIFQKLPASELDFQEKLKSITGPSSDSAQTSIQEIQSLKIKNVSQILINF